MSDVIPGAASVSAREALVARLDELRGLAKVHLDEADEPPVQDYWSEFYGKLHTALRDAAAALREQRETVIQECIDRILETDMTGGEVAGQLESAGVLRKLLPQPLSSERKFHLPTCALIRQQRGPCLKFGEPIAVCDCRSALPPATPAEPPQETQDQKRWRWLTGKLKAARIPAGTSDTNERERIEDRAYALVQRWMAEVDSNIAFDAIERAAEPRPRERRRRDECWRKSC